MSRGAFVQTCGAIGFWAVLLSIPADILSWFLAESYNPIAQTISALAVGRSSWLIDLGLLSFAMGCLALGTGMFSLRPSATGRAAASLAIIGSGVVVAVISFVNQYAGQENAGANIHMWMVFALYGLFAVAALASSLPGLRGFDERSARLGLVIGLVWLTLAPVYYFWFPANWAGAFERALVLLMVVWVVGVTRELKRKRVLAGPAAWLFALLRRTSPNQTWTRRGI